ncbi:MAG: lysine--tRNA ligase [Pseudomonadota bacterium]|nr:lysine--tRNA ligase [Pseudomonadota bacterium]
MTDENDIVASRRQKLVELRRRGAGYPNGFERSDFAAELHAEYGDWSKEALEEKVVDVKVAGRIMLRRVMGKASFITLQDDSHRIQCYLRQQDLGEATYKEFDELYDRGDIVGVTGTMMRTKKGELTVHASEIVLLTKSLQPLPEKYHGLSDQELKYRLRYVDLIMSDSSRTVFRTRSNVISTIRRFFDSREFLEVETPMMHPIPGGASARPFTTHHNSLDMELYLRVAPELYLKRLVVGGFERVYEINRNFRNEGLSSHHNPEFTMLEFYQAYATYEDLMDLTEELLREVVVAVAGSSVIEFEGERIDFGRPIRRVDMTEAVADEVGVGAEKLRDPKTMIKAAEKASVEVDPDWGAGKTLLVLFEALVEKTLIAPTFVTGYPVEVSPLSRTSDRQPEFTDRFELFVAGREIANGFSELNDPEDQAERFLKQAEERSTGDAEAMHFDADYIKALEYGLPPTAGEGIGIDRLVMLMTNSSSIRDVLLFPQMRSREG